MKSQIKHKLEWCVVGLGEDMNWWVKDISDTVHWDVDGLSILDPRQLSHILDLADPLREYGFDPELIEEAFYPFKIDTVRDSTKEVQLAKTVESILESEEPLFALPNSMDDDKSPYADLLDNLTKARVKMLNDLIEFEESLTVDEIEEEIREQHSAEYFEGKQVHAFSEITSILEFVPAGYELDSDVQEDYKAIVEEEEDFPDIEEEELEEDETMRWEDEEDEDEDEDDDYYEDDEEGSEDLDDDDDEEDEDLEEEEEEEEEKPKRKRR